MDDDAKIFSCAGNPGIGRLDLNLAQIPALLGTTVIQVKCSQHTEGANCCKYLSNQKDYGSLGICYLLCKKLFLF